MTTPILLDFWPHPPPCYPFYRLGLWSNITFCQIPPPPLSGWRHLWRAPNKSISRNFNYFWKLIYVCTTIWYFNELFWVIFFLKYCMICYIAFILILSAHKIIRSIKQCNALISTSIIYKLSISWLNHVRDYLSI